MVEIKWGRWYIGKFFQNGVVVKIKVNWWKINHVFAKKHLRHSFVDTCDMLFWTGEYCVIVFEAIFFSSCGRCE